MKIGIITAWNEVGAGYVSKAYMEELQNQGHEVFIFAYGGASPYKKTSEWPALQGNPAWDLPNVTWGAVLHGNAASYSELLRWASSTAVEVILFNETRDMRYVHFLKDYGFPVGLYVDYYTKSDYKECWAYDFLICNTRRHYSVFEEHPGSHFVQWGTYPDLFVPQERFEKNIAPESEPILFFHSSGRSWYRKGTDLILEAFQKVTGNVQLIIHTQTGLEKFIPAGDGHKRMQEILKTDERIKLLEGTETAPGVYHNYDVYLYPSRLDGIGLSLPEALSCGLASITTNSPPMSEFVTDEYNGLLVEVQETTYRGDGYYWPMSFCNVDDLARKMQFYVDNRQVLMEHKKNARQSVVENFNWPKNAVHVGTIMEDVGKKIKRPKKKASLLNRLAWVCDTCRKKTFYHLYPIYRWARASIHSCRNAMK